MSIATVVLAAGGSTRMGGPKQFLEYRGLSLVRRATLAALGAHLGPVAVVVGCEAERVGQTIGDTEVPILVNADWAAGIGSSIRVGISHFAADLHISAAIIVLADQPLVDAPLLASLARTHVERRDRAVACRYAGSIGVPALFPRALFPSLESLPAASGAKALLAGLGSALGLIDFPEAATDIDTPADYQRLRSRGQASNDDGGSVP